MLQFFGKVPGPATVPGGKPRRLRGAFPSPRHALAAARPHETAEYPAQFGTVLSQYSMWGNDTYGDCVTAEEACNIAVMTYLASGSEVVAPTSTVERWARRHGFLNGAALTDVMSAMAKTPLVAAASFSDGPYAAVNWTDRDNLCSAISKAPVKIAVAADQLQAAVGESNGWLLLVGQKDTNTDHCVALHGYGPLSYLAGLCGVPVPLGADPATWCYLLYTWSTVGIISETMLQNITAEAWLRQPSSIANGKPLAPPSGPVTKPGRRRSSRRVAAA